jgi:hypothetical protein
MLVVAPLFDKQRFQGSRNQLDGIVGMNQVQDRRQWTGRALGFPLTPRRAPGRRPQRPEDASSCQALFELINP